MWAKFLVSMMQAAGYLNRCTGYIRLVFQKASGRIMSFCSAGVTSHSNLNRIGILDWDCWRMGWDVGCCFYSWLLKCEVFLFICVWLEQSIWRHPHREAHELLTGNSRNFLLQLVVDVNQNSNSSDNKALITLKLYLNVSSSSTRSGGMVAPSS